MKRPTARNQPQQHALTPSAPPLSLSSDTLDAAYAIYEEFGPDRGIPRPQRLKGMFPTLSDADIDALLDQMSLVSKTVWQLAEHGGAPKMKEEDILSALKAAHPFLNNAGLKRAQFLINYYAWHEGYDK